MKKKLNLITLLALFTPFLAVKSSAQCQPTWKFFVPIVVTNTTSTSLSDFQVKITLNTANSINAGKMINTGDDIRFIDSGSCNPLPYWIESGINTANTIIWVKLPTLPGNAHRTIKMYYGNPNASPASDGDATFVIFDDFVGSTLNTSKWNTFTSGSGASISLSGGILTCTTSLEANIRSKASFPGPLIEEANITSMSGSWGSLAILNSGGNDGYTMFEGDIIASKNTMYFCTAFTPSNPSCVSYTGSSAINATANTLTGIWQIGWPSTSVQYANWPGGTLNSTSSGTSMSTNLTISIGEICGASGTMAIDWVRARNLASSEAITIVGNENNRSAIESTFFESDINIYPNPVHDIINIELKGSNLNLNQALLTDINGKIMQIIDLHDKKGIIELPISNLSKGIYFIKFTGNEGVLVKKIIAD